MRNLSVFRYVVNLSEHLSFAAPRSLEIPIDLLREGVGQDVIRLVLHEATLNAVQHLLAGIPTIPEIEECLVVVPISKIPKFRRPIVC